MSFSLPTQKTQIDELYKHIVTTIDNAITILSTDNRVAWTNNAFTKLSGYDLKELQQMVNPFGKMVSDSYFQRILVQVNQQKKSVMFELPLITKSGATKWLTTTVTPLYENNGKLKYYIILCTDISSKKISEERNFILNNRLNTLKKVYKLIISAQSFKEIANAALQDLLQMSVWFNHCSFILFDVPKNKAQIVAVSAKIKLSIDSGDTFEANQLAAFFSLEKGMVKIVTDTRDITKPSDTDKELKSKGILSYIMFPVMIQNQLVGSLNICASKINSFPQETIDVIREVGNALTVSIRQHQLRETIHQKNLELEKKNKDITDSIFYAKHIQQAILPSTDLIFQKLKDAFVLYMPRDIVSGDFYFFEEKKGKLIIAAADCTGHGVPGAFMSLIGNDLLSHIVGEKGITEPASILNYLNTSMKSVLKQFDEASDTKDGMDVALCSIDLANQQLEFAGAYRPLYLIRKRKATDDSTEENKEEYGLHLIKGNRFPVAGFHLKKERVFENHSVKIKKGDSVYIFSDGYPDQFGGEDRKTKMTTKRFKELLLSIQHLSMTEQEKHLRDYFESWMGDNPQIDDVLLIGIRF